MTTPVPLLAHIGSPNNPWIGVMTVGAWVLLVVFGMVAARRMELDAPGDLLLPLASAALLSGLLGTLGDAINDQGPWAVPAGLVVLVALLAAAFGDADFPWGARQTYGVIVTAVVASVVFYSPLEDVWFPTDELLPELQDATVAAELVEPPDADGQFSLRVSLSSATFTDNRATQRPDDPETLLKPRFAIGAAYLEPTTEVPADCASEPDCTEATFELTLPPEAAADPPAQVTVELLTADRTPFSPPLQAAVPLSPDA